MNRRSFLGQSFLTGVWAGLPRAAQALTPGAIAPVGPEIGEKAALARSLRPRFGDIQRALQNPPKGLKIPTGYADALDELQKHLVADPERYLETQTSRGALMQANFINGVLHVNTAAYRSARPVDVAWILTHEIVHLTKAQHALHLRRKQLLLEVTPFLDAPLEVLRAHPEVRLKVRQAIAMGVDLEMAAYDFKLMPREPGATGSFALLYRQLDTAEASPQGREDFRMGIFLTFSPMEVATLAPTTALAENVTREDPAGQRAWLLKAMAEPY